MLVTLKVKNFAIVDNIKVDLSAGLNVITGETGAGKSILAGALGLVLGERADKSMIRSGENRCGVEAVFSLADSSEVDGILEDLGLDPCEEGNLVIRRIVAGEGSGRNLLNDSPVTVQTLKRIGDLLVDMHGPHDHQSLLTRENQIDLLDSYGHLWEYRTAYEDSYNRMQQLSGRIAELDCDEEQVAEQINFLLFQAKEIEDADLSEEDENLDEEHSVAANANRIIELANTINEALAESENSAFQAMVTAQNALTELSGLTEQAEQWRGEAESINIQLRELADSVAGFAQSIETDNDRLQWLEDRMALLQKLNRKYGRSIESIKEHLAKVKEQIEDLSTRNEQIERLRKELAAEQEQARLKGGKLSAARHKTADKLAEAVTSELRDLGFQHGIFTVGLSQSEPKHSGLDDIEFGFAPNVGEPERPLRVIASSGEISRVMLAVKAVLALHDRIPVLVFDEIDTNVGGEMGNAIGGKLAGIAGNHQVICITHLAQVAAHGETHLAVRKTVREGRTYSNVSPIKEEQRVNEIARMLSGKTTKAAVEHAREMMKDKK
ncbi:MAG: DNA repair protein RecN [Verrucomicrobiota bacterium]